MSMFIGLIASIYVMVALYTDIRWMIIPNRLVILATVFGILGQSFIHHWYGLLTSIVGIGVVLVFTLGLYWVKGVGAGDVKGLAALGAITGAQFTMSVLIIALIYAGIVGVLIIAIRGTVRQLLRHWWISMICYFTTKERKHLQLMATHRVHSFPFMIAVMPAYITCLLIM